MSWTEFITASLTQWVIKGATALGLGVLTFTGWGALKDNLTSAISGSISSMGGVVYQLMAMGGFIDAVGIWLGAMTVVVALLAFKKLGVLSL